MNTSDLLEQLLRGRSGQSTASQPGATKGQGGQGGLGDLLGGLLGGGRGASGAGGLGGLGGLGGMLGGLLGGRGGSRSGSGKYAALASLGMMAFKAYQAWQQQQANAPQQALRTVDQLSEPEAEGHSHAILRALIAAAKADGRVDAQEEAAIRAELTAHAEDAQLQQWLDAELARPLDAQELASAADGPAMAAEMYLASVMLMGQQDAGERAWLDQLADALGLAPELRAQLDQQAKAQ
ncbi:DUF533 domain-containing protein [Pseudomonas rhizosphaerae]|jgi:uncharacterized membrane protein YebE (DUF533 family)|uniref:DUF533 domain-containing protein n=1 Tax=Pseudomonas rhizosphaerae TaxID=216142 RepID=UPI00177EF09E|nr:DUF533 domain-containing protein [Pseudomonas rhizosphaerae]MBD8616515.1 DUF533 domain-containing protein [Pseudomonas putida]MEB2869729.1 DUF533 domain-containing protein [Pseudomonas rhizosphaerae]